MCGICGLIAKHHQAINPEIIERMKHSIFHRGPDEQATFTNENVVLGFSRLSIVDVKNGSQPFFNQNKSIVLICNGEIYNYQTLKSELKAKGYSFRSDSDCEVIIPLYQEYGLSFVEKLEGMFALALVDFNAKKILLARDRTGIKPLVYCNTDEWFAFASEAKAILASNLIPRALDIDAVKAAFTFNYIPGERTIFSGIKNVPPATLISFDLSRNELEFSEYWEPTFLDKSVQGSLFGGSEYAKGLAREVRQAVSTHLIGDLPMSSYLSGGIDSSLVTTLLKEAKVPDLISFSIKFADKDYDESEVFNKTIEFLKIQSRVYEFTKTSFDDFKHAITTIEQPQTVPMDVPMIALSKLVHEAGRKVVLVGEGSDEILGGYQTFVINQIRRAVSMPSVKAFKPILLEKAINLFYGQSEFGKKLYQLYSEDDAPIIERFGTYPAWYPNWKFTNEDVKGLFADPTDNVLNENSFLMPISKKLKEKYSNINEFDKSIYLELKTRLPNYILARADKNSMANSVELRLPFLANNVLDYSLRIPNLFKIFGVREKHVLRKAFKDTLPKHIVKRRKFGYTSPNNVLWDEPCEEILSLVSKDSIEKSNIFAFAEVEKRLQYIQSTKGQVDIKRENAMSNMTGVLSTQILHNEYCC